jgi:hypothetical protein
VLAVVLSSSIKSWGAIRGEDKSAMVPSLLSDKAMPMVVWLVSVPVSKPSCQGSMRCGFIGCSCCV